MKLRTPLFLAAAAHAHPAAALRSLRGDDASTDDGGAMTTKQWLLQRVLGVDERKLRESLRASLQKSIGFGGRSLLPSSAERSAEAVEDGQRHRNLNLFSTSDPCAAATDNWPKSLASGNALCGHSETYTRTEVKTTVDTILSATVNGPGCLADTVASGTYGNYGACGVPAACNPAGDGSDCCICGACLFGFICLATICENQCYENSLQADVDTLVKHGVEVRKLCASCEEEVNHPGYTGTDAAGACDASAYAYDAQVSGLLVLPRDDATGTIITGAMPSTLWMHPTVVETCNVPSAFRVDATNPGSADVSALVTFMLGSSGAAAIGVDNVGFGNSWDYYKGYVTKKQYQTATIPLWIKAKRLVAQETGCTSEIGNQVTISGYSEGGYAAMAVAEAMEGAGAAITKAQAGAGPLKLSSAVLTTGYADITTGAFTPSRRYYLAQVGQSFSSTFGGISNFGLGQDLLNDSWLVDGQVYTKNDVIDITTDVRPGGAGPLNAVTPISALGLTDSTTLDIWNPGLVALVQAADSAGIAKPCNDPAIDPAAYGVDKLCQALVDNDLTEYIKSIGTKYSYQFCNSPDDEVIGIENVLEDNHPAFINFYKQVSGDHDGAGLLCIQEFVRFHISTAYAAVTATPTGDYCAAATPNPTTSPSTSPTGSPSSNPTKAPTTSPVPLTPDPTSSPTSDPTTSPTSNPTLPAPPTSNPTLSPTSGPSKSPTASPMPPTSNPTKSPTLAPVGCPAQCVKKNGGCRTTGQCAV